VILALGCDRGPRVVSSRAPVWRLQAPTARNGRDDQAPDDDHAEQAPLRVGGTHEPSEAADRARTMTAPFVAGFRRLSDQ